MTADVDGTGKGLVDFFEYVASKGLMNRDTAGALKTASIRILSIDDGWETIDLKTLDVDALLQRFETLNKGGFAPKSLAVYKSRFRKGLDLYQSYLENPSGFRAPPTRQRATPSRKQPEHKDGSERKADQSAGTAGDGAGTAGDGAGTPPPPPPSPNVVDYPFPLRQGVIVHLMLPPDLRRAEAKRLGTFIEALAMDDALPRALPSPEKTGEPTDSGS